MNKQISFDYRPSSRLTAPAVLHVVRSPRLIIFRSRSVGDAGLIRGHACAAGSSQTPTAAMDLTCRRPPLSPLSRRRAYLNPHVMASQEMTPSRPTGPTREDSMMDLAYPFCPRAEGHQLLVRARRYPRSRLSVPLALGLILAPGGNNLSLTSSIAPGVVSLPHSFPRTLAASSHSLPRTLAASNSSLRPHQSTWPLETA